MAIPSEKAVTFLGRNFKLHSFPYAGAATTFEVSQSATSAVVVEPASGGPSVTLGASSGSGGDPAFMKTVTLAAGGSGLNGAVTIAVAYGTTVGSSKA